MRSTQKYTPRYTYHEWLHWDGRWELIEGVPIAMTPNPGPKHEKLVAVLRTALALALKESGCKHYITHDPINFKIGDDTILLPDILVCGKINRSYLDFSPELVIEVLSKSTEAKDRGIKYDYYEREGVKYYLMGDVKKKEIEIHELKEGKYQRQSFDKSFTFKLGETCSISPVLNHVWE